MFILDSSSACSVRMSSDIAQRYLMVAANFLFSSTSGLCTLVLKKATAVCISGEDLLQRKYSFEK